MFYNLKSKSISMNEDKLNPKAVKTSIVAVIINIELTDACKYLLV